MKYETYSFRHAEVILKQFEFLEQFKELLETIDGIQEEDLITKHNSYGKTDQEKTPKSISRSINDLLKERLSEKDWATESFIFQNNQYQGDTWRLDFAKKDISIEVGFNHGSVIAWNLIKPVIASELNHVEKAIQTQIGVIITATEDLKTQGGFDNAIGTYEKYLEYLPPLRNLLTVPLLIIGLKAPETFKIVQHQLAPRKKIGIVKMIK